MLLLLALVDLILEEPGEFVERCSGVGSRPGYFGLVFSLGINNCGLLSVLDLEDLDEILLPDEDRLRTSKDPWALDDGELLKDPLAGDLGDTETCRTGLAVDCGGNANCTGLADVWAALISEGVAAIGDNVSCLGLAALGLAVGEGVAVAAAVVCLTWKLFAAFVVCL